MLSNSSEAVTMQLLVFTLDDQRFAFPLPVIIRVEHIVEIRFLPGAPEIIAGIINFKGQVIPVIDIRKRLGLPGREISPMDRMIIAHTEKRIVAILADEVPGLTVINDYQINEDETLKFARFVKGIVKTTDGLILIYDLDSFLSLDEELELDKSLADLQKNK